MNTIKHVVKHAIALTAVALLSACGGGSTDVTGTITGLTTSGLVLSNGTATLGISANSTSFTFPTLDDGTAYNVTVVTQPTGLVCTVTNGSGTASSDAEATNVVVACSPVFSISGRVDGLRGSGLVINNGTESISVAAAALTFAFPTQLKTGATYAVTVTTQPTAPVQTCTVAGGGADDDGSGTIASAAITTVIVTCTP